MYNQFEYESALLILPFHSIGLLFNYNLDTGLQEIAALSRPIHNWRFVNEERCVQREKMQASVVVKATELVMRREGRSSAVRVADWCRRCQQLTTPRRPEAIAWRAGRASTTGRPAGRPAGVTRHTRLAGGCIRPYHDHWHWTAVSASQPGPQSPLWWVCRPPASTIDSIRLLDVIMCCTDCICCNQISERFLMVHIHHDHVVVVDNESTTANLWKCSPKNLVVGSIWFKVIFSEVTERDCVKEVPHPSPGESENSTKCSSTRPSTQFSLLTSQFSAIAD